RDGAARAVEAVKRNLGALNARAGGEHRTAQQRGAWCCRRSWLDASVCRLGTAARRRQHGAVREGGQEIAQRYLARSEPAHGEIVILRRLSFSQKDRRDGAGGRGAAEVAGGRLPFGEIGHQVTRKAVGAGRDLGEYVVSARIR